MAEPDFYKVDEAARRLCNYDQGHDIDPEVWANDTPDSERQEYRREAYRYALVAEVMNTPTHQAPTNEQTMTNPWISEILTIIETEVLNKNAGLSEGQILQHAIEETGKELTMAEKTALYPQFRSAVLPELLRNARARGAIGLIDGLWYPVSGNPALTTARNEDRQTTSESQALIRWLEN